MPEAASFAVASAFEGDHAVLCNFQALRRPQNAPKFGTRRRKGEETDDIQSIDGFGWICGCFAAKEFVSP